MATPHHDRIRLAAEIIGRKESREYMAKVHENGNKTACTTAVLGFYGIDKNQFKFCQTTNDMCRHFNRNGFSMANVGKEKQNKAVIGKAIKSFSKYIFAPGFYLVTTATHVLLAYLSDDGEMSFPVDTNPNNNPKGDMRRIESLHKIKNKKYSPRLAKK